MLVFQLLAQKFDGALCVVPGGYGEVYEEEGGAGISQIEGDILDRGTLLVDFRQVDVVNEIDEPCLARGPKVDPSLLLERQAHGSQENLRCCVKVEIDCCRDEFFRLLVSQHAFHHLRLAGPGRSCEHNGPATLHKSCHPVSDRACLSGRDCDLAHRGGASVVDGEEVR